MTETEKLTKQRDLVAAAFNAIESKSMNLAMNAEDNEKKLADAFGELLDFIQTTDTKLNKTLSELEESK
ncbi:hypothetical protein [Ligilactobacillus salivarius]|uniref:Uncharacterized protein n=1 Tax=Ligilactobacillus salivarius TaxID=1624 RepID=A0A9X6S5U1_9LACO|nr:hypothetical protein [Ligilactobacillus salivarius]OTF89894.1 hypothetical protein A8C38_06080 [Ligilactobacillus salivarius]PAY27888.1 hypothetical protein A8C33_05555 [Ligilactobacillus salivarius]PAY29202.1 hypothetical protein A8C44_01765 [Ligilactobacillus salivarius]PAY29983.1 hypothetical protein A8C49_05120 [Ligilactobacillus salivarius]PAY36578.1 hypothetical protein A8C50_04920 [Ligilactobacillus salivarius]